MHRPRTMNRTRSLLLVSFAVMREHMYFLKVLRKFPVMSNEPSPSAWKVQNVPAACVCNLYLWLSVLRNWSGGLLSRVSLLQASQRPGPSGPLQKSQNVPNNNDREMNKGHSDAQF
jgi:hypothetical protein